VSVSLTAGALGAVACGVAALAVRPVVARLPEPVTEPGAGADADADAAPAADRAPSDGARPAQQPAPSYADVAAEPGLTLRAVACSGVAGALLGGALGWSWALLFLLPLVPVGAALGLVDLRTRLLPNRLVRPALLGVVVLGCLAGALAGDPHAVVRAVVAAVVVFLVFFVLWWVYPPGMGFGDVRLSAVLGFALGWLGWGEVLVGIYGAFLAFSVPGALVALVRRDRRVLRTAYPFGPFLLGGAVVGVVVGDPVWRHLVGG
jgi:leader peptidase (prepilin peptidase)/N-methyltransferase